MKKLASIVLGICICFSFASVALAASSQFNDVSNSDYFAEAIQFAVKSNITNGLGDGTFGVNQTVTRAQAVTFLWRTAGQPVPQSKNNSFTDIKSNIYYKDAVLCAVEQGITNGVGDNKFNPDSPVTRGQIITFLWREKGCPNDIGGAWNESAEKWANEKG